MAEWNDLPVLPSEEWAIRLIGTIPAGPWDDTSPVYVRRVRQQLDGSPATESTDDTGFLVGAALWFPGVPIELAFGIASQIMAYRYDASPDPDETGESTGLQFRRVYWPVPVKVQWKEVFTPAGGGSPVETAKEVTLGDGWSLSGSVAVPSSYGETRWQDFKFTPVPS